jgi:hypothetical protein
MIYMEATMAFGEKKKPEKKPMVKGGTKAPAKDACGSKKKPEKK